MRRAFWFYGSLTVVWVINWVSGSNDAQHVDMAIAPLVVAGAAMVAGKVIDWLSNKGQANAQKEYNNLVAKLHNEWLATRKQEVKDLLDELLKRGQDIFGPQVTTTAGTTTGTTTGRTSFEEEEAPEILAEYQPMAELQRKIVERRLSSPTGLPAGYEQTGIEAINLSARPAEAARANFARERGISENLLKIGDPNERARVSQIASFRSNLPLQARQLQTEDLSLAEQMLQARMKKKRKGSSKSSSTTTGETYGTTTTPPNYSAIADLLLTPGPQAAIQS